MNPVLVDELKQRFPHGHPAFVGLTVEELALHDAKNHDYALGGDPLGNFKRIGAILALYPGLDPADPRVVALTYLLKQLDAVLWGIAKDIAQKVEGLDGRLADVGIYAKILRCIVGEEAGAPPTQLSLPFGDTPHKSPAAEAPTGD